ncbi:MAG: hypothetical protein ACRD1T_06650 [Acidimicrobiia bacterium]
MSQIRTRKTSRTEVTIETDELLVIRDHVRCSRAWCASCGLEVDVIPLTVADLLQGWRAASEAHRLEVAGAVFVCINSLIRSQ